MRIKISIILICLIIAFYLLSLQYGSWEENLSANISIQMRANEPEVQPVQPTPTCTVAAPAEILQQPTPAGDQTVTGTSDTGVAQSVNEASDSTSQNESNDIDTQDPQDINGEDATIPTGASGTGEATENPQAVDQESGDNSGEENEPQSNGQSDDNGEQEENQAEDGGNSLDNTAKDSEMR